MRRHASELAERSIEVAIVTFSVDAIARRYVEETGLRWPLLLDAERALYRAYGMLEASPWEVWGPRTLWAYAKEIARGRLPGPPSDDPYQRGGDVLVDPGGVVRFHHVGTGPADRPEVARLLAFVRGQGEG